MKTQIFRISSMATIIGLLGSVATPAEAADNQRREWFQKYDENNDKRWKGKEARNFKKDHEQVWEKQRDWCDSAKDKPKKYDVNFPKDVKEKKVKCKKFRVDEAYMRAWIRDGGDGKKEAVKPALPNKTLDGIKD